MQGCPPEKMSLDPEEFGPRFRVLDTECTETTYRGLKDDLVEHCRSRGERPLAIDFTNVHIVALRERDAAVGEQVAAQPLAQFGGHLLFGVERGGELGVVGKLLCETLLERVESIRRVRLHLRTGMGPRSVRASRGGTFNFECRADAWGAEAGYREATGRESARGTHHVDDIVHDITTAHGVDAHLGLGRFHRHRALRSSARHSERREKNSSSLTHMTRKFTKNSFQFCDR